MLVCPVCGAKLPDGTTICPICGAPLDQEKDKVKEEKK